MVRRLSRRSMSRQLLRRVDNKRERREAKREIALALATEAKYQAQLADELAAEDFARQEDEDREDWVAWEAEEERRLREEHDDYDEEDLLVGSDYDEGEPIEEGLGREAELLGAVGYFDSRGTLLAVALVVSASEASRPVACPVCGARLDRPLKFGETCPVCLYGQGANDPASYDVEDMVAKS